MCLHMRLFNELICLFHGMLIDGLTALASNVSTFQERALERSAASDICSLIACKPSTGRRGNSVSFPPPGKGYRGKGMMNLLIGCLYNFGWVAIIGLQ
jgi:hypothetical protein